MVSKEIVKAGSQFAQLWTRAKTQQVDTRMGKILVEDQFAEVSIVCNQNSVFSPCACEHLAIWGAPRKIAADSLHVMPLSREIWAKPSVCTLIQKKLQPFGPTASSAADCASFRCGE